MPGNEFEAQFKRSGGESPPQTTPRNVIDGKEAIAKYIDGSKAPMEMTGAELHACVAHLKTTYGGAADGLEADLMKIRRQQDKKIKLVEWVQEKEGRTLFSDTAPAPLTDATNGAATARPTTAPPAAPAPAQETAAKRPRADVNPTVPDAPAPTPREASEGLSEGAAAALLADFGGGRDHLSMTGADFYGLVGWLKAHGHPELEDTLMRVKLLGDKKYQLVGYIKKHGLGAAAAPAPPPAAAPEVMVVEEAASTASEPVAVPPLALAAAAPAAPVASTPGGVPRQSIHALLLTQEQTLTRMEESFSFAVQCMQADMAVARENLVKLRAQLGA